MSRSLVLLVASFVSVASATGMAADAGDDVRTRMIHVAVTAAGRGYSLGDDVEVGSLHQGSSQTFDLSLSERGSVMLVANCDTDCSDVDLVLLEPDGREVVADRRADSIPVIHVPASHRGPHKVRVEMASCRRAPCSFALGLFSK